NLVLQRTLDREARSLVRSRAAAQLSSLRVEHGRLTVGEAPDNRSADSYVWVFTNAGILERPRAPAAVQEAVRKLVRTRTRFVDAPSPDPRLYAASVLVAGERAGTVVAGVSLAPYEETREAALVASFILGVVVFVLVALVGWWVLGASL